MKTKKQGNNWTAWHDPETDRYFAEIMYTSREGREEYHYEITRDIYDRLGTMRDDVDNERLIKTAKQTYSNKTLSLELDGTLKNGKNLALKLTVNSDWFAY